MRLILIEFPKLVGRNWNWRWKKISWTGGSRRLSGLLACFAQVTEWGMRLLRFEIEMRNAVARAGPCWKDRDVKFRF